MRVRREDFGHLIGIDQKNLFGRDWPEVSVQVFK
jgi:hypothetical protein